MFILLFPSTLGSMQMNTVSGGRGVSDPHHKQTLEKENPLKQSKTKKTPTENINKKTTATNMNSPLIKKTDWTKNREMAKPCSANEEEMNEQKKKQASN